MGYLHLCSCFSVSVCCVWAVLAVNHICGSTPWPRARRARHFPTWKISCFGLENVDIFQASRLQMVLPGKILPFPGENNPHNLGFFSNLENISLETLFFQGIGLP